MFITTPQDALRRTYQEESLFGLQQVALEIEQAYVIALNRCEHAYRKLQTVTEMADQHRAKLKNSWRSTPSCSSSRRRCLRRKCRCSYADYCQYRSMRESARELEREFIALAKHPYALRATWQYVVIDMVKRLLHDYEYQQILATTLELAGDLPPDIAELARFSAGWMRLDKFTGSTLVFNIGIDPVHTVAIDTAREPLPYQKR